jgi:hypothetical protein
MQTKFGSISFEDVDTAAQGSNAAASDEWFDRLMRRPGLMLAALGLCVAAEWTAITPFGQSWCPGYAANVAEWLRVPAMFFFLSWSVAVCARDGENRMWGLWTVWMAGWGLFVGWIAWADPALIRSGLTLNQMLVPTNWWATMGASFSPGECYLALGVLAAVLDACSGLWVTKFLLVIPVGLISRLFD